TQHQLIRVVNVVFDFLDGLGGDSRKRFIRGILQLFIQRVLVVRKEQLAGNGLSEVAVFLLYQASGTKLFFGAEISQVIFGLIPGRSGVGVQKAGVANE